jgi:ABC-type transport system substrate-binding protein
MATVSADHDTVSLGDQYLSRRSRLEKALGPEWYRLLKGLVTNPLSVTGIIIIAGFILVAAFAPLLAPAPTDNYNTTLIDRETFVRDVRQGQGLPMKHFAPPGIFGAPPIDEIGVGYDPEFAAAQMAEAGYPNCEGFPQVTLLGYSGQATLDWIEFAQASWEEHLGCGADLIQIEQQAFAELLASTEASTPDEEAPHMWTLGWGPDYADENNWVGDVLWCGNAENRQKRECAEVDDLIVEAREESDPDRRIELYAQIEEMFFGYEGEYPFFPIWLRIAFVAEHSWVDRIPALFGGDQIYNWSLDWDAKMAARGM